MNILEVGYTTLVSFGFTVEFGVDIVTITKRYGEITMEDVRLVTGYIKPAHKGSLRQQGPRVFTVV